MNEARQAYEEANGIVYELRAYNGDGETVISYTGTSFDDVSGYAFLADEAMNKVVSEAEEGKDDDLVDAEVANFLDERGY